MVYVIVYQQKVWQGFSIYTHAFYLNSLIR